MTLRRRIFHGLVAGTAATTAEATWSRVEPHLLGGRPPVFDTTVMASALLSRVIGRPPRQSIARVCGTAMRCGYGPLWATAASLLTKAHWRGPRVRSVAVGAVIIWSFELIVLPRSGATPALRRWPAPDIALDLINAVVYSAAAAAALGLLARNTADQVHDRPRPTAAAPRDGREGRWPRSGPDAEGKPAEQISGSLR